MESNLYKETCPFPDAMYNKIKDFCFKEENDSNNGFELRENIDFFNCEYEQRCEVLEDFCIELTRFILSSRGPSSYKQKLRDSFELWIDNLCDYVEIEREDKREIKAQLPNPFICERIYELVKELHDREGVTKVELSNKLGVNTRTILKDIEQIEGRNSKKARIFGQEISVAIRKDRKHYDENVGHNPESVYSAINTVHPLGLLLNVQQVGTLLNALAVSYIDENRNLAYGLGADIWCQLSDYGKQKVKNYFVTNGTELEDFINALEDDYKTGNISLKYETEMDAYEDMMEEEQLNALYKTNHMCDIIIGGEGTRYENYKIVVETHNSKNEYVAYPVDYSRADERPEKIRIDLATMHVLKK